MSTVAARGFAHRPHKDLIENFPEDKINKKIPGIDYTAYELMEHMRIAQWDILEFTKDQTFKSPDWPEGYWPEEKSEATIEDWDKSVKQFFTDQYEIESFVNNDQIDLTDQLPEAEDYNYLREIFLVAAHNSYHLGQLVVFAKSK
ncbi:MAG: DinB family protein [Melioribacteraceae bacterium]|nr:DinB family protein [Melioribacteraceae bacterium]